MSARVRFLITITAALVFTASSPSQDTGKKKLTREVASKIKRVGSAGLSPDGKWATYTVRTSSRGRPAASGASTRRSPARSSSTFHLREIDGDRQHELEGRSPKFSEDSRWVGFTKAPPRRTRSSRDGKSESTTPKSPSTETKKKPAAPPSPAPSAETKEGKPAPRTREPGAGREAWRRRLGGRRGSGRRGESRSNRGRGAPRSSESGGEGGARRRPSRSPSTTPKPEAAKPTKKTPSKQEKPPAKAAKPAKGTSESQQKKAPKQEKPGAGEKKSASPGRGRWLERLKALRERGGSALRAVTGRQATLTKVSGGASRSRSSRRGNTLVIRNLDDDRTLEIKNVATWMFIDAGRAVLYTWTPADEKAHGIYRLDLDGDVTNREATAIVKGKARYSRVAFDDDERFLTFWTDLPHPDAQVESAPKKKLTALPAEEPTETVAAEAPKKQIAAAKADDSAKEKAPKEPMRLWQWVKESGALTVVYGPEAKGYPKDHDAVTDGVSFSPDRRRLFISFRPKPKDSEKGEAPEPEGEMQEIELPNGRTMRVTAAQARRFREMRGGGGRTPQKENDVEGEKKKDEARLDVWHWKDAQIATMKNRGRRGSRSRSRALLHAVDLESGDITLLGHERLSPTLNKTKTHAIASDDDPYAAERTWDRSYSDWYVIDTRDGSRRRFLEHTARGARFSPDGSTILAFDEPSRSWIAIDPATLVKTRLDVDPGKNDDSRGVPSAGSFGRMLPDGRSMVWSDGKDLWSVPLDGSPSRNMTRHGRRDGIAYSHLIVDSDHAYGHDDRTMLLTSVNERTKAEGVHSLDLRTMEMSTYLCMDKDIGRPVKAKDAERFVLSVSSSQHPSDLWVADAGLGKMRRLTNANEWLSEYAIPESEIIEWRNTDGDRLQGILVKPVGYQPGKRYPTIVYIYELQSNGLHRFRTPGTQLNPQAWAQNGYAVFMPDITYQIGKPGMSSVRCVVPGVQKLIELGVADPDRVGLCGHSWGGYETAYIITQTKLFKAAISGAPVVNMTSAYGGIRWSSGLPRQFQYERTQSRIGGSLWEFPERYIENSPLFHLENVETPTLIMFGNRDGAVPWYQGIEFYLGLRRLGKECVFLEYKDEDHGLRRKPNQEDYHQRIMQWWDHYLKGVEAPDWIKGPESVAPIGDIEPSSPATPAANG